MGLSERRACSFADAERKMIRYRACRPSETELRGKLRDLANERRRFGYRLLFILLRRERAVWPQPHLSALPGGRADGAQPPGAATRVGTRAPILVEARPNGIPPVTAALRSEGERRKF